MNDSNLNLLKDLVIENKCDELLIARLEQFSEEARMVKIITEETFSDQELVCRLMACLDDAQIEKNFPFLKYCARRFQIDEEMFFDFLGRELK